MRDVVIMRGLPGSGKSTLAKNLAKMVEDSVVCSADDFFNGGPIDVTHIPWAHQWCQKLFRHALERSAPLVIVDNTNTAKGDIDPYMLMASEFGYDAQIIEVACDTETSVTRNIHAVPRETIEKMAHRMETSPLDPSWRIQRYTP